MSKFTKEAPFEFEGVKVYYDYGLVNVDTSHGGTISGPLSARAIHAMVEAERDEWRWTNDDHTEARRGRWSVEWWENLPGGPPCWAIWHDDLSPLAADALIFHEGMRIPNDDTRWVAIIGAKKTLNDFLAWKAAQEQPVVNLLDSQAGAVNIVIKGHVTTVSDDVLDAWSDYIHKSPAITVAEARKSEGVTR